MFHDIMGLDRALPWLIGALVTGYLAGTIPVGVIIARVFKLGNLRNIGSGNTGATNVLRTGNKLAAFLTLVFDMAKAGIPAYLFLAWGDLAGQAAGLGAVLGHCFPIWTGFRGGKGVASFIGMMLALYLPAGMLTCSTWMVTARLTKISSAGGLAATALAPVWLIVFSRWEAVLVAAIAALVVWAMHAQNIRRLIAGTEPRIGAKS